jgi:ketosteroid isomerase-like protein
MKNFLLSFSLFLAPLLSMAGSAHLPNDARDCTESFFQAMLDEDAAAIRRLITFDFLLIGPDGRILDGGTFAESVASGSVVIENGRLSGTTSRQYGDAGVVTGFWNARGTVQGYRFDNEVAFSAMCVRQGGSWKIASVQLTARL